MEDDDDFGDLYTDVLQAFPSHHHHHHRPSPQSLPSPPKQPQSSPHHRPIDLNAQFPDDYSSSKQSIDDSNFVLHPVPQSVDDSRICDSMAVDGSEDQILGKDHYVAGRLTNFQSDSTNFGRSRVLENDHVHLPGELGADRIEGNEKNDFAGKSVEFDDVEGHDNVTFDVEEEVGADLDEQQLIPGLSSSGPSLIPGVNNVDASMKDVQSGEGDDWDSDSEDDLQIVLNDDTHGRMTMDGGVMVGSDDEDGNPLVIVGDGDGLNHQGMGEQEWGEDGAQAAEGERNDIGDGIKGNGGMAVPPKVGYSNHGYHPFHAQFKYVRPATAPIAGAPPIGPPGGAPVQARPPFNMSLIAGRGRGDWRPPGIKNGPMQKAFQPGFGMPPWGNGAVGRGFGGGLEFTLPSHKTIFEVDIDNFEDKPWKYPGADVSDFFNFGLNEESWKDYFKQLEQLRLESTMQSKIRVHETVRVEQDYDPDMPPELVAATNVNDCSMERANLANPDCGQIDLTKGSAIRPPLMTGRAIPVEAGSGERLPSIDTRPPRMRDSDAIIEIVLQVDDCSLGEPADHSPKYNLKESYFEEVDAGQVEPEIADDPPHTCNGRKRKVAGRRAPPFMNSDPDGNEVLPKGALVFPDSRGQSPVYPASNHASPSRERHRKGTQHDSSPQRTASQSSKNKFTEDKREESLEDSMDEKQSPPLSSPATDTATNDPSFKQIDAVNNELVADGNSEMEADERPPHKISLTTDSSYSKKKQNVSSRLDHHEVQEVGEGDDSKTARSSGNSKVRPVSNRDYHKMRDTFVKDDIVHDRTYNKRHTDEDEQSFRRRERNGRLDIERKRLVVKGMEDSYHYRDGFDRRKERDSAAGIRQRRFEDPHGRPVRVDDPRKREFGDEMGSRQWGKSRDDRIDKDEHLQLRKPLENGNWRERDDTSKGRYENFDEYYNKRRKDEQHMSRDYVEKEEMMLGHREIITHRKREREDIIDQHQRGGQPRIRDNLDDHHHSIRKKDEIWLQRERREKQRDDRHIIKQSHEESLSKRDREDGRGSVKSGRGADDKLVSHSRARDEYRGSDKDYQTTKDTGRHSIHNKRKDCIEDEGLSQNNRGREDIYPAVNPISNEERRSGQERLSTHNDPSQSVADIQRGPDKKSKDTTKKNRDSEGLEHSTLSISKRNQEGHRSQRNETVKAKGTRKEREGQETSVHCQSSKQHKDNASSDEEQQDSRRGRSKLERWTSHQERDFSINSKLTSSSTLKLNKEIDRHNNDGSAKLLEAAMDKQPSVVEKDAVNLDITDAGSKPVDERHLDTVAKLKKRSERFKLPMPSEKETITSKKMESEGLPIVEAEANVAHIEIKQERPARKRRWVSN